MELFLDTNIYLSFYKLSDDDLEELQKLTVAVKSKNTTLYVTDQVRDEFNRNREAVVATSLKAFEASKLPSGFPRLLMNYPDYETMQEALGLYEKHRNALLKHVREAAADKKLHADGIIEKLFKLAHKVPLTEEIWTAARRRYDLGNPPGKEASYGDAINWESLLSAVPEDEDLLLVTGDTDFISKLDDSLLADALRAEWTAKKKTSVTLYKNLTSLFKDNYPDIKLASELEKELAVAALVGSQSFVGTHSAIQGLLQYTDFSPEHTNSLIRAANRNDQIYRIWDDEDVYDFFMTLAHEYEDAIDPDDLAEFRGTFGW